MKKMIMGLIVGTLISTYSVGALAAPGGPGPGPKQPGYEEKQAPAQLGPKDQELKSDAGYILDRTVQAMKETQKMARQNHNYSGLALAMAHQRKAQKLYSNGSYREAIFFSLRARDLTLQIMKRNHGRPWSEFARDAREQRYHDGPRDEELDAGLDRDNIGRDKDAVHLKIEFNL